MTEIIRESSIQQILKKIRFALICLSIFGIFVVAVVSIQWYCWGLIESNIPEEKRAAFGDMFGSINTLFSGLAFAGVLFTIVLQGWELSATRSELKLSREAHEKSSLIMDEQLKVLQKTLQIEQVRLDQQFLPIFVPRIPVGHGSSGVSLGSGEYSQSVSNKGMPIVNVVIERLYRREVDKFISVEIPFVDSGEVLAFKEFAEPYDATIKYHTLTYNTLDDRLWKTTLVSEFDLSDRLMCRVVETEQL
tara:strand:+ start:166899 stop:167642 length:744 start_codon:yes stop_codon:yes gene_type:complete